jgi:WD40 repeat protein
MQRSHLLLSAAVLASCLAHGGGALPAAILKTELCTAVADDPKKPSNWLADRESPSLSTWWNRAGDTTNCRFFRSVDQQNQTLAQCIKSIETLSPGKPQHLTANKSPRFAFASAKTANIKAADPRHSSPDGKVRLELHGNTAQLVEAATAKSIGAKLNAGTMWTERHLFTFTCWSFSPDGKFVATGSEFVEGSRDITDVGRVQVWDAATGKLLAQSHQGGVTSVAFSPDGKTVVFNARPRQIDGP